MIFSTKLHRTYFVAIHRTDRYAILLHKWGTLTPEQCEPFYEMEREDIQRFNREMRAVNPSYVEDLIIIIMMMIFSQLFDYYYYYYYYYYGFCNNK